MAFDDANSEARATPPPFVLSGFCIRSQLLHQVAGQLGPHHTIGTGLWSEYVRKRRGSKAQIHFRRSLQNADLVHKPNS